MGSNMNDFTCIIDGCKATKYEALGMCRTHYRRSRPRKPDAKVIRSCDWCAAECEKEKRAARYAGTYCSLQCRDAGRSNGRSCEIPATHWIYMQGATCEWVAPPAKESRGFQCGSCDDCEASFTEAWCPTPSRYCSDRCATRVARRRRRAREHDAAGSFRYSEVMRLYSALGKTCAYCELPVKGLPDPEHVLPLSRGGRNDLSNLLPACRRCNADKGDLTLTEWAVDRERRGLPAVRTRWSQDNKAFRHLVLREPSGPAWRDRIAA